MRVGRGSWNWDVWGQGVGSALGYSPRAKRRSEGGLKTGGFLERLGALCGIGNVSIFPILFYSCQLRFGRPVGGGEKFNRILTPLT